MAARDCPYCERPTALGTRTSTIRRGDKTIEVTVKHWVCQSNCVGDDGSQPFAFEDMQLLKENSRHIKATWLEVHGEEMPKGRRIRRRERSDG